MSAEKGELMTATDDLAASIRERLDRWQGHPYAGPVTIREVRGLLDQLTAARARIRDLEALQQAIAESRDDPAGAIVRADRLAGEAIMRATAAEAAVARLTAAHEQRTAEWSEEVGKRRRAEAAVARVRMVIERVDPTKSATIMVDVVRVALDGPAVVEFGIDAPRTAP